MDTLLADLISSTDHFTRQITRHIPREMLASAHDLRVRSVQNPLGNGRTHLAPSVSGRGWDRRPYARRWRRSSLTALPSLSTLYEAPGSSRIVS